MNTYTHVVEDTAGQLYAVRDCGEPVLAHVWFGVKAKRVRGGFAPVAGSAGTKERLVRRAGCRVVAGQ